MGRWLAVREEWQDVRYGNGRRSGGYVVGHLITRIALAWVEAHTKREALAAAPFGTTTVLSFLSLDVDDRDGWLQMPLGVPQLKRVRLFDDGKAAAHVDAAVPRLFREQQLELIAS